MELNESTTAMRQLSPVPTAINLSHFFFFKFPTRDWTMFLAVGAQHPNHWTPGNSQSHFSNTYMYMCTQMHMFAYTHTHEHTTGLKGLTYTHCPANSVFLPFQFCPLIFFYTISLSEDHSLDLFISLLVKFIHARRVSQGFLFVCFMNYD